MLWPFTSPKIFCTGPNFLSQPKNLTAFSASSKTFVLAQKPILLNANHLFVWHKMFVTPTICKKIFGLAQKIWTSPKHFGTCKRTRHKLFWLYHGMTNYFLLEFITHDLKFSLRWYCSFFNLNLFKNLIIKKILRK